MQPSLDGRRHAKYETCSTSTSKIARYLISLRPGRNSAVLALISALNVSRGGFHNTSV